MDLLIGERPRGLYEVLIAMHRYSEQHIFDEIQLNDFYFGAALGAGCPRQILMHLREENWTRGLYMLFVGEPCHLGGEPF